MSNFYLKIKRFLNREDGPTAVEYAVMLAMIVLLAIAAIITVGQEAANFFQYSAGEIGDNL